MLVEDTVLWLGRLLPEPGGIVPELAGGKDTALESNVEVGLV